MTTETQEVATTRLLNESAIREHALRCSKTYRANKFTRVGQDFMDEVHVDIDNLVRNVRNQFPTLHPPLHNDGIEVGYRFVTGNLIQKINGELERAIGRLIQNKVQRQPTVGKTLGRTR